jgi:flagellar biosynthesis protein FlhG
MTSIPKDQAANLRTLMDPPPQMKIVTVASGKGGVGKSSFAVNLAIILSGMGLRTLVIDADFGLANIDVMLGGSSVYNVGHVLSGEKTLPEIIQEGYAGVRFISGGSGVTELLNLGESQLQQLLDSMTKVDFAADIIICDAGAGITENLLHLVAASTETIVVTTPEPTSIVDAYALIKTIVNRDPQHQLDLVMNKCNNHKEAARVSEGFLRIISSHMTKEVNYLGFIHYDREVAESIKRQTPLTIASPGGQVARDMQSIARLLLEMPLPPYANNPLSRLFMRLMGVGGASRMENDKQGVTRNA